MTQEMIEQKVKELKKLRSRRDALDKQIEDLESLIKAEMTAQNQYEFSGEDWKVTWNIVSSSRFDQSSFKEAHPKLFEQFKKLSESRRFNLF